jgi:SAM-dependent methyltransferase
VDSRRDIRTTADAIHLGATGFRSKEQRSQAHDVGLRAMGESTLVDDLRVQEEAWNARPIVRKLYHDWYDQIVSHLSQTPGRTVELGSGISRFKHHYPPTVATDIEPTPWVDEVVDAEALPYEDASVANLVLIDVFHHLPRPTRFLDETVRVLAPGGRAVLLDPYCSPVSYRAYRRFHHERTDLAVPAFEDDAAAARSPMASNQARATLVFFRERGEYERRWPALPIVETKLLSLLAYPLSGGFTRPKLAPDVLYGPLMVAERALMPLARLLAFRCLVVLERS